MDLFKNKKLFSAQKDDPKFLERQAKSRHGILKDLSRAVKEVQLLFMRSEGNGLGDSRPVQRLCARFEDVLRHGLKVGWFGVKGKQPTFWPLVSRISRKQAIDYINNLQYAQSDNGRCRAWVRLAANECSLESYVAVLCQDTNLLNQYYETYSFLRDEEMVVALKQLLTGLAHIAFNITVDTASLEIAPAPEALQPALRLRAPQPVEGSRQGSNDASPGVPSSISTPLASSSSSSWLSDSSSQPIEDPTPNSSRVDPIDKEEPVDTIRDEQSGLEASVKVEGDTFVIDVLTNISKAPNDLERFDNVNYNKELWSKLMDKEEPPLLCDGVRSLGHASIADLVKGEGMMPAKETIEKWEETTLDDRNVSGDKSDGETTPSYMSPITHNTSESTLQHEPSPLCVEKQPPLTEEPPLDPIEKTPPRPTPDSPSVDTPLKDTPPAREDRAASSERVRLDSENDEKSFYDVLCLATGITTTTTTTTAGDDDTQQKTSKDEVEDQVREEGSTTEERNTREGSLASNISAGRESSAERNDMVPSGNDEGVVPIDHVTTSDPVQTPTMNPFDDPESPVTPKATISYFPTSPVTPTVENSKYVSQDSSPPLMTPPHFPVTPPLPQVTSSPFHMTLPPHVTPPSSQVTSPFHTTSPPDSTPPPFEAPPPTVAPPTQNDLNPFNDDDSDIPSNNPFDPNFQAETQVPLEIANYMYADTNPFLSDILREASAERAREQCTTTTTATRDRSSHMTSQDILDRLAREEEEDEFLVPQRYEVVYGAPEVHEDHFTPELSLREMDSEIVKLKSLIIRNADNQRLQKSLVELQLQRQKIKESSEEMGDGEEVLGHILYPIRWKLFGQKCDTCNKPGVAKRLLQCRGCGYLCHSKCKSLITRKCVASSTKDRYIMAICPEKGLSHQHFRCSCCNVSLNEGGEARLCDYYGHYMCAACHHNDLSIIPARVMHNWDFTQRRVCVSCSELLAALASRPLINIKTINTSLYTYIQDITAIESLREDIMRMKPYLVSCSRAREEKLLQELDPWPHFKDTADMFSLNDLVSIHTASLLPQLQAVHKIFLSHIKNECDVCLNKGCMCDICHSREAIYSFSKEATPCVTCSTLYHRECFQSVKGVCPACKKQRTIDSIPLR